MFAAVESSGCSLACKVEGQGQAVIFVQGVGVHGDGWLPQTRELQSHFRCVTFDNRGIGGSQPAGSNITVDQMAQDALAVMSSAGIDAAHWAGHSLGGAIALQVALTAPDRVRSLSLLCTSGRGADATRPDPRLMWRGLRSRLGTRRMRSNAFLEIVMPREYLETQNRDALAERLAPVFGHELSETPPVAMRQLGALRRFDVLGRLKELAGIPTLVVSAEHDIIFPPRCGKALAAGIPGARYIEIPAAAHGVTIQKQETINQLLREHFGGAAG